jgi:hypothetical protein
MSVSNYRESHFQHPSLTKIIGEPNYDSLAIISKEAKANGKSVDCTLGGGEQGHLGLIVTDLAYERLSATPFIRPVLPIMGDTTGTAAQIVNVRRIYDDDMKIFTTCHIVERTLIQQITAAIDSDYLADLLDENGSLTGTIAEIFQHLFENYGL